MEQEKPRCGRCGEIWVPVFHPPSGRRLCQCWTLTREQLEARKKPVQKTMIELAREQERYHARKYR